MIGIIIGGIAIFLAIILFVIAVVIDNEGMIYTGVSIFFLGILIMCIIPNFTGVINYVETNDYDKARITAVDTVQTPFRIYWKVQVEYLTNTPTQDGIIVNKNIEKDIYYTDDKELVNKLRENMYKEIKIVTGYKGGYEKWDTFREKLIKNYEILEVE